MRQDVVGACLRGIIPIMYLLGGVCPQRIRQLRTAAFVLGMMAALLLVIARPAAAQEEPIPVPLAPPSARIGEPYYLQNCAPCHGDTGNGDGPTAASLPTPPTAFADPAVIFDLSPSELFSTTKYGRIELLMPPWQNQMSDAEIWNTVAFVWSLHTDESALEAGASIYAAECAACHGAGGAGDGPEATAPMPDFTDRAWAIEQSQADLHAGLLAAHPDMAAELSDEQQSRALEYVRSFSLSTPWSAPYVSGTGSITGTVTQGTAGGSGVAGLVATLDAWLGSERVATITTTVSNAGTFVFTELSTDPNLAWIASVANQGVSYSSDFLALSPTAPSLVGNITVYDTTADPSVLRVDRMNWIVETLPQTLTVGQIYAVGNSSDRTFVGNRPDPDTLAPTFAMQVPAGALDVAFENGIVGGRFVQDGSTFYDTLPIAPGDGTRQIIMRYDFPYTGATAILPQPLLYETGELNLFVSELPDLTVSAPPLISQGVQEIPNTATYQLFSGAALAAQTLTATLTGLLAEGELDPRATPADAPVAPPTSINQPAAPLLPPWVIWTLAGAVMLALVLLMGWGLLYAASRDKPESDSGERDSLLDRIALLDDLHAQGQLSDEAWQSERSRLKQQVRTLKD